MKLIVFKHTAKETGVPINGSFEFPDLDSFRKAIAEDSTAADRFYELAFNQWKIATVRPVMTKKGYVEGTTVPFMPAFEKSKELTKADQARLDNYKAAILLVAPDMDPAEVEQKAMDLLRQSK